MFNFIMVLVFVGFAMCFHYYNDDMFTGFNLVLAYIHVVLARIDELQNNLHPQRPKNARR